MSWSSKYIVGMTNKLTFEIYCVRGFPWMCLQDGTLNFTFLWRRSGNTRDTKHIVSSLQTRWDWWKIKHRQQRERGICLWPKPGTYKLPSRGPKRTKGRSSSAEETNAFIKRINQFARATAPVRFPQQRHTLQGFHFGYRLICRVPQVVIPN